MLLNLIFWIHVAHENIHDKQIKTNENHKNIKMLPDKIEILPVLITRFDPDNILLKPLLCSRHWLELFKVNDEGRN